MAKVLTAEKFFSLPLEQCEAELEAKFFSSLKMRNGTFKTTAPSRFAEVEPLLGPIVAAQAKQLRHVLDIGVSSGTTTIEFADFLKAQGADVRIVATDLFAQAHMVELLGSARVLTDSTGFPLQYDLGGNAIRAWIRRLDYVTLAAIPLAMSRAIIRRAAIRKIRRGNTRRVELVSRRLSLRDNIELIENDIMAWSSQLAGSFDFVRAANILNVDYFATEQLSMALRHIKSYLRGPGALLLVTRTMESPAQNAGSLFRLRGDSRFDEIQRIGGGSEIKDLVLQLAG